MSLREEVVQNIEVSLQSTEMADLALAGILVEAQDMGRQLNEISATLEGLSRRLSGLMLKSTIAVGKGVQEAHNQIDAAHSGLENAAQGSTNRNAAKATRGLDYADEHISDATQRFVEIVVQVDEIAGSLAQKAKQIDSLAPGLFEDPDIRTDRMPSHIREARDKVEGSRADAKKWEGVI